MALPMLVGGADCGPSNPLQGLSKQFDRDRGIQQDHFGAGRAGPSRETFRTQQAPAPGLEQDAARFFSSGPSPAPQITVPSAFDLSSIHGSLPATRLQSPVQSSPGPQTPLAAWASDFVQQQPRHSPASQTVVAKHELQQDAAMQQPGVQPGPVSWSAFQGYRMSSMPSFSPSMALQTQHPVVRTDQSLWEREFQSQESSLASTLPVLEEPQQVQAPRESPQDQDDLARTAGLLVESVKSEQNPKFQNSQFMGLMKQLRDRMVVVEGNNMVERDGMATAGWASEFHTDIKGKGKAAEPPSIVHEQANYMQPRFQQAVPSMLGEALQEDPNDAYFRQENEDYTKYWTAHHTDPVAQAASSDATAWDGMQHEWDRFEAGATGIKTVEFYKFQANNPYLLGDSSRTRHHTLHSNDTQTFYESVLELEAAVQRDPSDASAWFELGVKQQENEREQLAIQALQRAVNLNPTHLPSWLALAVSHTNDNNRLGTCDAISEWVTRNKAYEGAVNQYRAQNPENPSAPTTERFHYLIDCLIAMARSDTSGQIDADIQIALAVVLNTNEEYEKAQDCFRTALEVRPDDWLLYNRVGATMANSGRAEEALQYYYRALELNPAYIRARFNLGISCINLRRYEEAAQHILDALVLQDSDRVHDSRGRNDKRGVTSSALWESLKTTCLHMQRLDLATLCDRQDLEGFRGSFQLGVDAAEG